MKDNTFMKKENRDAVYFSKPIEWRREHSRSSGGPYLLHPQYVTDYEKVTGVELTAADKGFGNTIYKTMFPRLYFIHRKG